VRGGGRAGCVASECLEQRGEACVADGVAAGARAGREGVAGEVVAVPAQPGGPADPPVCPVRAGFGLCPGAAGRFIARP
jgi:hypothetical protein